MFNINQLIVTVEAGIGNCTIPMILLESKVFGEVRNWSGRLSVVTTVQLEVPEKAMFPVTNAAIM